MSLLLDALKKAADDKKKKSDDSSDSTEENNHDENAVLDISDESLDLELHPDNDSEDPQLDESALYEAEEETTQASDSQEPEIHESISDKLTTDAIDEAEFDDKPFDDKPLEIEEQTLSQVEQSEQEIVKDTSTEHSEEPASDSVPHKTTAKAKSQDENKLRLQGIPATTQNLENTINNEHALSELINKSNKHNQAQKRKQLLQLGLLVALVLIGSSLYFYLQMSTATQDIYISQSNTSNINRDSANNRNQTRPVIAQEKSNTQTSSTAPSTQTANTKKSATVNSSQTTAVKKQATTKPKKPTISIVRTKKSDPIHDLLTAAYTAFNQSDYSRSDSLYNRVLQRESNNRDALLGLAAIAIKQQRYEVARQKYQFLLSLNPRDSIATAGLSSIKHLIDPQLNESKLKFMIKQQPDEAHLYFALGSLYSTQEKWPEAQSAYFSAWSAENKNADYAYNLAVSLDHLDKHKQALDFYRLSLKLSSHSNINFSTKNTQHRINTLQGSGQ